jgi:hypothetical protein
VSHCDVVAARAEHPPHRPHLLGIEIPEHRIAEASLVGVGARHRGVVLGGEGRIEIVDQLRVGVLLHREEYPPTGGAWPNN